MTWFKVDDGLWGHRKWVALHGKPGARALWVTAGSWCASNLTDGWVPAHMLAVLGGRKADAAALVDVDLWHVATHGGWTFHEWNQPGRQPSRTDVEAKRSDARDRMQRARERTRSREQDANVRANSERSSRDVRSTQRSPYPDPTRPDPTQNPLSPPSASASSVGARRAERAERAELDPGATILPGWHDQPGSAQRHAADSGPSGPEPDPPAGSGKAVGSAHKAPMAQQGTRITADFALDSHLLAQAKTCAPDVDPAVEHPKFVDYWLGIPGARGRKVDWPATWRNWMRKAQDDIPATPARNGNGRPSASHAAVAAVEALRNSPVMDRLRAADAQSKADEARRRSHLRATGDTR